MRVVGLPGFCGHLTLGHTVPREVHMGEKKKYRAYTQEQKVEAVKLVRVSGQSLSRCPRIGHWS